MRERKGSSSLKNVVIVILVAALFTFVGIVIASSFNLSSVPSTSGAVEKSEVQVSKEAILYGEGSPFVAVAEKVKPTVVSITAKKVIKTRLPELPFEFFQGPFEEFFKEFRFPGKKERKFVRRGLGSGIIVDREGYILTNNHVVAGAEGIVVKLANEKEFDAEIIGQDPETDVALIKLKTDKPLPDEEVAKLGDSDAIKVGDWAIAVGNPYGLGWTVTVGVISAKGRHLALEGAPSSRQIQNFIQTDAAINFGNSGGPLVNVRGEVIGINTAIKGAPAYGLGFAVPINLARTVMTQLKEKGKVTRGALGIKIQDVTQDIAEAKGLPSAEGVLVSEVYEDSPAEKGGLEVGDVIVKFEGKKVKDADSFVIMVASHSPGEKVKLTVLRDGREKKLSFTLASREGLFGSTVAVEEGEEAAGWLGMEVADVRSDLARSIGIKAKEGVVVTNVEPGSPADDKGIRPGDLILQVGGEDIKTLADYQKVASKLKNTEKPILFLIKRGDSTLFVAIKPGK
ncbi:MAG TPA: Do family serine endopeptidase [Candidatus Latescibacteria bacterium]|nr:Do family serine endopeptidase [Candidatus Latescibacterota bacterium]